MEIVTAQIQGRAPVTIIRAQGIFDANSVEQFMESAQHEIDHGATNLLLDLSKVSFMSSIGIRIINALYFQLHPTQSRNATSPLLEGEQDISKAIQEGRYKAPHLKILSSSENITRVLSMAGVDMYIDIFDDEQQAVQAFDEKP